MKKVTIDNNSLAHTSWNCKYHMCLRQNTDERCFSQKNDWKYEKYYGNYVNGKAWR